ADGRTGACDIADGGTGACDVVTAAAARVDRVADPVELSQRNRVAETGVAMCLRASVEAEAL
ncbi:MAG: hypothetical protein M3169_16115, partial [Candidatus Eremiobacteraeota bacterium]|nr:hypothetical protein [Candidatus Eremiobacteraeota bacterium]